MQKFLLTLMLGFAEAAKQGLIVRRDQLAAPKRDLRSTALEKDEEGGALDASKVKMCQTACQRFICGQPTSCAQECTTNADHCALP